MSFTCRPSVRTPRPRNLRRVLRPKPVKPASVVLRPKPPNRPPMVLRTNQQTSRHVPPPDLDRPSRQVIRAPRSASTLAILSQVDTAIDGFEAKPPNLRTVSRRLGPPGRQVIRAPRSACASAVVAQSTRPPPCSRTCRCHSSQPMASPGDLVPRSKLHARPSPPRSVSTTRPARSSPRRRPPCSSSTPAQHKTRDMSTSTLLECPLAVRIPEDK